MFFMWYMSIMWPLSTMCSAVAFARSWPAYLMPVAACLTPVTAFKAFWTPAVVFKACFTCLAAFTAFMTFTVSFTDLFAEAFRFFMSVAAFTAFLTSVVAFRAVFYLRGGLQGCSLRP